jgi:hypothetical protein
MKYITELIESKPSKALQAMIDGLRNQSKRNDFRIVMTTFGESNDKSNLCFGCAATCAVQELAKTNFTQSTIGSVFLRANKLQFDIDEFTCFEFSMDKARIGDVYDLFTFCNKQEQFDTNYYDRFFLTSYTWEEQVPKVEKLIKELEEKGL